MDRTTTTDSLGIVTLASAAFRRGQLTQAELATLIDCADGFTRALSLANKYREVSGQMLELDGISSPATLRSHMERGDLKAALREAERLNAQMDAVFQPARARFRELGLRVD